MTEKVKPAMTDATLREWIERAQFTVTSPTSAPHVNEPIQVVTVEGLLAALAGTYLSGVSGHTEQTLLFASYRIRQLVDEFQFEAESIPSTPEQRRAFLHCANRLQTVKRELDAAQAALTSGDGSESRVEPLDFGMGAEMNKALAEDAAKLEALTGEQHAYTLDTTATGDGSESAGLRVKLIASFDKVIPDVETRVQIVGCILATLASDEKVKP